MTNEHNNREINEEKMTNEHNNIEMLNYLDILDKELNNMNEHYLRLSTLSGWFNGTGNTIIGKELGEISESILSSIKNISSSMKENLKKNVQQSKIDEQFDWYDKFSTRDK